MDDKVMKHVRVLAGARFTDLVDMDALQIGACLFAPEYPRIGAPSPALEAMAQDFDMPYQEVLAILWKHLSGHQREAESDGVFTVGMVSSSS